MKKIKILLSVPVLILFFVLFQIESIAQTKNSNVEDKESANNVIKIKGNKITYLPQTQKKHVDTITKIIVIKEKEIIKNDSNQGKKKKIKKKNNEENVVYSIQTKIIAQDKTPRIVTNNVNLEFEQPLYIIDNVVTENSLSNIAPNTIEYITVLKGEEAITKYGEKGKNGVVLITTKKNKTEKDVSPTAKTTSFITISDNTNPKKINAEEVILIKQKSFLKNVPYLPNSIELIKKSDTLLIIK